MTEKRLTFLHVSASRDHWGLDRIRGSVSYFVPYVFGGVLLVAAALKTMQIVEASGGAGDPLWSTAALIQIEILCGLALLFGLFLPWSRWAALSLFACFAAFAFYKAASGARSCTCFGNLSVYPWYAFISDVVALAALNLWQPIPKSGGFAAVPSKGSMALWCCSLAVFPALAWFGLRMQFPVLLLDSPIVDLGRVKQGEFRKVAFWLRNPHSEPVVVTRWNTSCPCLKTYSPANGEHYVWPGEQTKLIVGFDTRSEPDYVGTLQLKATGLTRSGQTAFVQVVRVEVVEK